MFKNECTPCGMLNPVSESVETMTMQAVEMMVMTQKAIERLADERVKCKMSAGRVSAIAKELKQLGLILGGYNYQHTADRA